MNQFLNKENALSSQEQNPLVEVRVVEASAGSGKTYALAKRYVQLLLSDRLTGPHLPIREILALTFTNKAAFEMKARILDFLKALALGQMPDWQQVDILAPLDLEVEKARQRAFVVMEEIVHHYNFFQVQTIDKFINALLSGCAFKIGLTANFNIRTNVQEYLQYSLDLLIDQAAYHAPTRALFENFLHYYLYLENRSGWFPKEDMLAIVTDLFHQHNTYARDFEQGRVQADDLAKSKSMVLKEIQMLHEAMPQEAHAGFRKSIDKFVAQHSRGFDVDSLSDYLARAEMPVRKKAQVSDEAQQLWALLRMNIQRLCEQEAYALFAPYVDIFEAVNQGLGALCAKDDVLFLGELNKKAGLLFDDEGVTVAELYYRLATRFHHYLIDEFQDTSRLQWHNMAPMVEEALSTGGTLFYVGDRKQAIYGFRGGDVALFDEIKEGFAHFNVQEEPLKNNWRSQEAIVSVNNAIFNMDNLKSFLARKEAREIEKKRVPRVSFHDEDMIALDRIFGRSQQSFSSHHNQGQVCLERIEGDRKEDRDMLVREKLLACIRQLQERFRLSDIAILSRGNREIEQMTTWLLEEDILVASERTSSIKENLLIQELMALLQFLHAPVNNLAFTTFILGDLFAAASGMATDDMHAFVFAQRQCLLKDKGYFLYIKFRETFPEIWDQLFSEFFKQVGLFPLYELLVSIYSRFECLTHFSDYQGFLMHFLNLVKKQEDEHLDLGAFLDYFEALEGEETYVPVVDTDAVRILTIHKSKGLEFPVVIIPFLGMDIQIGSSSIDNHRAYILRDEGPSMALMRMKQKYLKFSDPLYAVYAEEYKKALVSELNNIYVAMTRACHELYAFIPQKTGQGFNWVNVLIPDECWMQGAPVKYELTVAHKGVVWALPCATFPHWIDYLKEEFSSTDDVRYRQQRLQGQIWHHCLAGIGNLYGSQDLEEMVRQLVNVAVGAFDAADESPMYYAQVMRVLTHEAFESIFYGQGDAVLNEKEIVNAKGHVKRLDRLILKANGDVWVVDFKSRRERPEADFAQVREYCQCLREIYPHAKVIGKVLYGQELMLEDVHAS